MIMLIVIDSICAAKQSSIPQLKAIPRKNCGHQVKRFANGYTKTGTTAMKPTVIAKVLYVSNIINANNACIDIQIRAAKVLI